MAEKTLKLFIRRSAGNHIKMSVGYSTGKDSYCAVVDELTEFGTTHFRSKELKYSKPVEVIPIPKPISGKIVRMIGRQECIISEITDHLTGFVSDAGYILSSNLDKFYKEDYCLVYNRNAYNTLNGSRTYIENFTLVKHYQNQTYSVSLTLTRDTVNQESVINQYRLTRGAVDPEFGQVIPLTESEFSYAIGTLMPDQLLEVQDEVSKVLRFLKRSI